MYIYTNCRVLSSTVTVFFVEVLELLIWKIELRNYKMVDIIKTSVHKISAIMAHIGIVYSVWLSCAVVSAFWRNN